MRHTVQVKIRSSYCLVIFSNANKTTGVGQGNRVDIRKINMSPFSRPKNTD